MTKPKRFFGRDPKENLKKVLASLDSKKETPEPQPKPKIIIPASNISNPEAYLILEGRTHGSYSYPDLLVSKERKYHNHTWNQVHKSLHDEGNFMLTIRQYVDFLNLLKSGKVVYDGTGKKVNPQGVTQILNEIIEVRSPYRAEWLDAKFRKQSKKGFKGILGVSEFMVDYGHRIVNGPLQPKYSEPLEDCLMTDRDPGIDLEDWLQNATSQGLPLPNANNGSLHYWFPRDQHVAGFGADSDRVGLDCDRNPQYSNSGLGVRQAREKI
ncbi:MAG: hypothetical protein Q8R00_01500 [Candidatus Nanoarchaeia archaeon]|nr:hypothetical protein [Candidatus Nanoarchaeia archaeon]